MSQLTTEAGSIPEWTLGDHLRKAREHAGLKQTELADMIGVSRSSMVSYESDKTKPSRPILFSWALATGVPLSWLQHGVAPGQDGPEGDKRQESATAR